MRFEDCGRSVDDWVVTGSAGHGQVAGRSLSVGSWSGELLARGLEDSDWETVGMVTG